MAIHPELVAEMKDHAAAAALALTGQFDDRIAALKEQQAAIQATLEIAKTIEEAQAYRAQVEAEVGELKARAEAVLAEASDSLAAAERRHAEAKTREGAVAAAEAEVRQKWLDLRQAQTDAQAQQDAANRDIIARSEAVADRERMLDGVQASINEREAALKRKLDLLAA
jgi:hypothetical protein